MNKLIEKYDGKKYTLKEYLPVIIVFIFVIGNLLYSVIKKGDYVKVSMSTIFDEKIVDIYEEKGNSYLLLSNKNNRFRIGNTRNYDYSPYSLHNFLKENDQVIKNQCSDTLFVVRDSENYHFIIGSTSYNRQGISDNLAQKYLNEREILNERNDCD